LSIRLESVTKVFRHHPALFNWMGRERTGQTLALDNVSLSIPTGTAYILLGPNGSGKTTALKLISTVLLPDSGRVLINDADTETRAADVRAQVSFAVATERSFFPRLSARENLDFFATLDNVARTERAKRTDELLAATGLTDAADTLVMKFSTGMYQRLGLARALMKRPPVLLLDEPTRSLDPAAAAHFWTLIRDLSAASHTIVLATHSFNEALAVGQSIAILAHGKIAGQRSLAGIVTPDQLRSYYFKTTGEHDETLAAEVRGAR